MKQGSVVSCFLIWKQSEKYSAQNMRYKIVLSEKYEWISNIDILSILLTIIDLLDTLWIFSADINIFYIVLNNLIKIILWNPSKF